MEDNKSAQNIELMDAPESKGDQNAVSNFNMSLIKDVKVNLDVQIGTTSINVAQLMSLKVGEKLALDKEVDEPVNLVSDGKLVALGRLVAIDGCFGIEITEISAN